MKRTSLSLVLLFTVLVLSGCQQSEKKELHLNALFTDHVVLQQKK
ncbi:MAG: lipoprotein [Flavobacteriaceae bacterium]